jgi:hypothetical protein
MDAEPESYPVRLVVDVGTHTYEAYVRAPGAATDTRIGGTLTFRTEQQSVTELDAMTVPAGIGTVRACHVAVAAPSTCLTGTAGQPWPTSGFAEQNGRFTAAVEMTAADASTDAGVGLGRGPGKAWTDLAAIVIFSSADTTLNHTIAARDGDHYVSSGLRWTPKQTYVVRFVIDVNAHTYHASVRSAGASTETGIGGTLAFRTEQQSVTTLDTMTVPAAISSVRACGPATGPG